MFGRAKSEQENERLREERRKLKDEIVDLGSEVKQLKQDRKVEEEDIKHLLKMKEEAVEIEKQKYQLKCDSEKNIAIAAAKDEFRDKLEALLKGQIRDTKEMYSEILARLPDVNVRLKGEM